jgi:hypothetical protein
MAQRTPIRIDLTTEERAELERRTRSLTQPHRVVVRAKVILGLAADSSVSAIAREVGLQRRIVRKWATRFVGKRLNGLDDEPRSGRPPLFSPRRRPLSGEVGLRAAR